MQIIVGVMTLVHTPALARSVTPQDQLITCCQMGSCAQIHSFSWYRVSQSIVCYMISHSFEIYCFIFFTWVESSSFHFISLHRQVPDYVNFLFRTKRFFSLEHFYTDMIKITIFPRHISNILAQKINEIF